MKFTLIAPLLLSSTAFAGAIRVKRQDPSPTTAAPSATTSSSFTICRDARDCLSGERCQFVTHNGLNNGYNGACVAENYSYVPPPQPTALGPCVFASDCRDYELCNYRFIDANGVGQDGHCSPTTTDGVCSFDTNCVATQYCDNGKCTNYRDCRYDFCPGGECVPEQANVTDYRTPNNAFVCQFTSSIASSSASSAAASSSDSIGSAATSAATTSVSGTVSSAGSAVATAVPEVSTTSAPVSEASSVAPAPAPAQPSTVTAEPAPANNDNKDDSAWRDEYRDQQNARKF